MDKTNVILGSLFCVIMIPFSTSQNNTCPATYSTSYYGLTWPKTTNKTLSNPPCVNKNMEFLYRNCNKGIWATEPDCFFVQPSAPPSCPSGFFSLGDYCYFITSKSTFPPKCPLLSTTPFNTYKTIIPIQNPVWMPIRRNTTYGLGFLQWIEPTFLYKTDYNGIQYVIDGVVKNKNCLLYYNSTYIAAVSCEEQHPGICIYTHLDKRVNQLCNSNCHQNNLTSYNSCFCVEDTSQQETKAQFLEPYQNTVYNLLTDKVCAIGLEKNMNGSYVWTNLKKTISYSFWSSNVTFDKTHIYGAATSYGWILTEQLPYCALTEKKISQSEPSATLSYDSKRKVFLLTILQPKSLFMFEANVTIVCFTDAHDSQLLYKYTDIKETKGTENITIFEFNPLDYGPGHYWCEYIKYPNLSFDITNVVFVDDFSNWGTELIAIFNLQYILGTNPLSLEIINFVQNFLLKTIGINNLDLCFTSRIFKIIDVNEAYQEILINVHFTLTKSNLSETEEYIFFKSTIEESFSFLSKDLTVRLFKFLSPNYCMEEVYKNLTWSHTLIGKISYSEEYCFDSTGQRVGRECRGDFINGAYWLDAEDCEVSNYSSLTEKIILVTEHPIYNFETNLLNLTQHFDQFNSLDIYIISNTFLKFVTPADIDVFQFVEIITNLLNVDKSLLKEAQTKMLTSNLLLTTISNLMDYPSGNYQYFTNNFVYVKTTVKQIYGLLVTKKFNRFEAFQLQHNFTLDQIVRLSELECAILLSPQLQKQFLETDQLTLTAFLNNSFFVDNLETVQVNRIVFGISLPETVTLLEGPFFVVYRSNSSNSTHCSYWSENLLSRSHWIKKQNAKILSDFYICEYWISKYHYFSLVTTYDQFSENITADLLEVLNLNKFARGSLMKLTDICKKHDKFIPLDVHLVGKILQKIHNDEDANLDLLASVVSDLHKINRSILVESQIEYASTDTILQNIDTIAQNSKYVSDVVIVKENFIIIIYKVTQNNISGITLLNERETTKVQILKGNVTNAEINASNEIDSGLWFSQPLIDQLRENTKIIITVFLSNALFIEKTFFHGNVGKIFGVVLPNVKHFTGPILIINKRNSNTDQKCAYWYTGNYNKTTNGWKEDKERINLSEMIQCQFWQATYFTFLIVDEKLYFSTEVNFVTNITCTLSIIGLLIILLTGILFKNWRLNTGNLILLNFSVAILLEMCVYSISTTISKKSTKLCTAVGSILHYTLLSQFFWMLVIAILQIKRYVVVLGGPPKAVLLKSCIFCWGIPFIPVISVIIFDTNSYIESHVGLCYPSGMSLYISVWFPIFVIVCINLIIFVCILYNVYKSRENIAYGTNETILQIKLAILLFFMLGLSWSFGILASLNFGIICANIFCIMTTLQGFVMFLFFIVFNTDTRNLYLRLFKAEWNRLRKII